MGNRCRHIRVVGYDEWACGITGISVDGDCGQTTTPYGIEAPCIPLAALWYRVGTLSLAGATPMMREAIMRTAEGIRKRSDESDQSDGSERSDPLAGKTEAEIDALIKAGKERKRQLLGRQLMVIKEAIDALREGRAPAVMPKIPKMVSAETQKAAAAQWTPERRKAQGERLRKAYAAGKIR